MAAINPDWKIPSPVRTIIDSIPGVGLGVEAGSHPVQAIHAINTTASDIKDTASAASHLAKDLVNPNWWIRVAEFLVGSTLIIVGVNGMLKAGQHVRRTTRTVERGARVAASVTPTGSAVNRAARSTARTARRSRA